MNQYTPFILFAFGLIVSLEVWLVTRSFNQATELKLLKQAFEFYIQQSGKGAAVLLNTPNPAPEHIRPLLRKYVDDKLTDPQDRETLLQWARQVAQDRTMPRDERGIAYQLVATLGAEKQLPADTGVGKHAENSH